MVRANETLSFHTDDPVFTVVPTNTTGNQSGAARFRCRGSAHEQTTTRWHKLNELGEPTEALTSALLGGRGFVTQDGDLVFEVGETSLTHKEDSRNYKNSIFWFSFNNGRVRTVFIWG